MRNFNEFEKAKAEIAHEVSQASDGEVENCPNCGRAHVPADIGNDEVCKVCDIVSGITGV